MMLLKSCCKLPLYSRNIVIFATHSEKISLLLEKPKSISKELRKHREKPNKNINI